MRDYPLQQRTIGHLLADKAKRNGTKTWLIWQDASYSYADLHELTNRYANGFSSLGIAKGQHVAVMLPNGPHFLFVVWGLGKIGAVAVPLNTAAKGELLRYFIDQSNSSWIVVEFTIGVDSRSPGDVLLCNCHRQKPALSHGSVRVSCLSEESSSGGEAQAAMNGPSYVGGLRTHMIPRRRARER